MNKRLLGCIADDFTGATDLANNLVRAGMRVVQVMGLPTSSLLFEADAVVVALKSRTIPKPEAIQQSLNALKWLREQGACQIYFKYCSTFDSTTDGNIGPVTEALMTALSDLPGSDFTIATPAFPDNNRTVFKGHLFVGEVLLNESGMQDHPLTPMNDPNLVRVLQDQCQVKVGLVDYQVVKKGEVAIRARFEELKDDGVQIAVVDAISNDDLMRLGPALSNMPLITAGSGVAIGLPGNFGLKPSNLASQLPVPKGTRAVISGSCSSMTNLQVKAFLENGWPAFQVHPEVGDISPISGEKIVREVLTWASNQKSKNPILVYSSANPEVVKLAQDKWGVAQLGAWVENVLSSVALGLIRDGVAQLVVAGGETSGACVQALGIKQMTIGPQIDPGVPWCYATCQESNFDSIHISLKSGNFGGVGFFEKAFGCLT